MYVDNLLSLHGYIQYNNGRNTNGNYVKPDSQVKDTEEMGIIDVKIDGKVKSVDLVKEVPSEVGVLGVVRYISLPQPFQQVSTLMKIATLDSADYLQPTDVLEMLESLGYETELHHTEEEKLMMKIMEKKKEAKKLGIEDEINRSLGGIALHQIFERK